MPQEWAGKWGNKECYDKYGKGGKAYTFAFPFKTGKTVTLYIPPSVNVVSGEAFIQTASSMMSTSKSMVEGGASLTTVMELTLKKKQVSFDLSAVDAISVGMTATFTDTSGNRVPSMKSNPSKPASDFPQAVDFTPYIWPDQQYCGFKAVAADKYQEAYKVDKKWTTACTSTTADKAACTEKTTGCRACLLVACPIGANGPGSTICDLDLSLQFLQLGLAYALDKALKGKNAPAPAFRKGPRAMHFD